MKRLGLAYLGLVLPVMLTACAGSGGDQNYRELQTNPVNRFRTERDPLMGARVGPTRGPATQPQVKTPASSAMAPPRQTFSRAHWTPVTFSAAEGRTTHGPIYFADAVKPVEPSILDIQNMDKRLSASLVGANYELFTKQHAMELVAEPVRFGFDIVVLPVNLVRQPPWAWQMGDTGYKRPDRKAAAGKNASQNQPR